MISGRGAEKGRANRIRPPRRIARNILGGDADFDACWDKLKAALQGIHARDCNNLSFEELYRASYKIVLRKKGDLLYDRVKQFEEEYFAKAVIPKIEVLVTQNLVSVALADAPGTTVNLRRQMGASFLEGLHAAWDDHNRAMNMTADILMYLDRGYSIDSKRPSIFTTTIGLFRDHILRSSLNKSNFIIFDILNSVILDQINMERSGDFIDRGLIRSCTGMLYSLYETDAEVESEKLYLTVFEPAFLTSSEAFYRKECENLLANHDASHWLRTTRSRLQEEEDRCRATIRADTRDKIIRVVEQQLIVGHLQEFLAMEGSGLRWMLDNDKMDVLAILYQLVSRVDEKKELLRAILQSRVVELGIEIEKALKNADFATAPAAEKVDVEDGDGDGGEKSKGAVRSAAAQQTAAAIRWVDDVLALKDKFDRVWRECFAEDLLIQTSLTKSFSQFINMFGRSAEYVSLFIDDNLKRGIRGKTEAEVDEVLEKAITIIRYLQDKDMFERYYQKHLARRLLHQRSESHDVEKQMISRMKQELGNQFTSKFEGMFRDLDTSRELTTSYREHVRNLTDADNVRRPIELTVNILTTNNWPPEVMGRSAWSQEGNLAYPPEIQKVQENLTKFYLTNRTGRKLTWVSGAGTAELRCLFPAVPGKTSGPLAKDRRYEITMSTFAMVIVMLFNDMGDGGLMLEEIQEKTHIPMPELVRTLTALSVAPKFRILVKDPATKSVKPGDSFRFNESFQSKSIKVKLPNIAASNKVEAEEERKETEEKNNQTRSHIVDAAIVRIMKQRKELGHSQLITEVISQLVGRFQPEVALVKKRIEDLISRDYLERVEDTDSPTYRYLA